MLEGKRFLPDTGMPILKTARRMVLLAVELPEPFLVPTVIEKSFTTLFMELLIDLRACHSEERLLRRRVSLLQGRFFAPLRMTSLDLRSLIQQVGVLDE